MQQRLLSLISLLFIWNGVVVATPAKKALLINIANYETAKLGWDHLPADRDRLLMHQILLEQGFGCSEIRNEQATFAGIGRAIQAFTDSLGRGDMVIVYFSGHGQQLSDDNGDEADRLDEAYVPFDAPVSRTILPGYGGEKHIRDDRIGQWIARIRLRIGSSGHLLLLMDSCYSGDINRGEGSFRGGKSPIVIPPLGKAILKAPAEESKSGYVDRISTTVRPGTLGRFVVITASEANELNANVKDHQGYLIGALTYATGRAFRQLATNSSYRRLFTLIAEYIAEQSTTQHPTLEGDGDQPVFGGAFVARRPTFQLTDLTRLSQRLVQITGGYLSGLFERSGVALYPVNHVPGAPPLATGRIVESSLTHSWVTLDSGTVIGLTHGIQVEETQKMFGSYQVNVSLSSNLSKALNQSIRQAIGHNPTIRLQPVGDLQLDQHRGHLRIRLSTTFQVIDSLQISDPDVVALCLQRITAFAQANLLRRLILSDASYAIEAELLPVHLNPEKKAVLDTVTRLLQSPYLRLPTNVQGQLTITNRGNKDVYITLIDIMPDGRSAILLPDESIEGQEKGLLIRAGQRSQPIWFQFSPPYGTEVYKIIATARPLGLTAVRGGTNSTNADPSNVFEEFFDLTYRGDQPKPLSLRGASTTTLTFQIIPPSRH